MRILSLIILSVTVPVGAVSADDAGTVDPKSRVSQILNDLSSADFRTRLAAQAELEYLNEAQIAELATHIDSTSSAEAAVRCTQSLKHHFLHTNPKIVQAAWDTLEGLRSSRRPVVRDEAIWILQRHWPTRLRLATARLKEHGALVLLPETAAAAQQVRQLKQSKDAPDPVGRLAGRMFGRNLLSSTQVFLTDEWKGGPEELKLLQRLPGLQMENGGALGGNVGGGRFPGRGNADDPSPASVFLVAGHPLSDEETQWLKGAFGNRIQDRGLVMLGITSNAAVAGKGCPVSSVVAFGSGDAAGVLPGDMITSVGDEVISSFGDLVAELREYSAGDTVPVTLKRSSFQRGNPIPTQNLLVIPVRLRSWADYVRAIHREAAEKDALPPSEQQ